MRRLPAHRIVRVRRAGRMAYYRLEDEHVRRLLEFALTPHRHTTAGTAAASGEPLAAPAAFAAPGR